MKKSGVIMKLADGRTCIAYNDQPLMKEHKKMILHLVNEKYEIISENGKPKTLLRDPEEPEIQEAVLIGFIN